jgi:hypothetical protein
MVVPPIARTIKELDMKRCVVLSILLTVGLAGGCARNCGCGDGPRASEAGEIVERSLNVTGGLDAWKEIDTLEGEMLLKVFGPDGSPYVTRVMYTMHFGAGRIDAKAPTGEGMWTASVDAQGSGSFTTDGALGEGVSAEQIKQALGQVLHRLRGAGNIVWGREKPYALEEERIDGIAVRCVSVRWTQPHMRRYCFEENNGRLRFAISAADQAGEGGWVTVYKDYTKQANGMILPMHLRQVGIGEYVLLGDSPIWDVQLLSVTME